MHEELAEFFKRHRAPALVERVSPNHPWLRHCDRCVCVGHFGANTDLYWCRAEGVARGAYISGSGDPVRIHERCMTEEAFNTVVRSAIALGLFTHLNRGQLRG